MQQSKIVGGVLTIDSRVASSEIKMALMVCRALKEIRAEKGDAFRGFQTIEINYHYREVVKCNKGLKKYSDGF